jgi:hypothetical protein
MDIAEGPKPPITCKGHLQIRYIMATQYAAAETGKTMYNIEIYSFCNNCAIKMADKEEYHSRYIPELDNLYITKLLCKVKSNGYQYQLYGHAMDWQNWRENGESWE